MELVSLTPEGRILLALKHGRHTYGELKFETGLSDRWLAVKLKELEGRGIVGKDGRWYGLRADPGASAYELSLYMRSLAKRVARELAKLPPIRAIILFGSVAQNSAHEYSDLDMIIVMSGPIKKAKRLTISRISKLESKCHIAITPLILAIEDFLDNVRSREGGIIYGIAEGYEVLLDKTGELAKILHDSVMEIRRSHDYLKGVRIWVKAK
ncbi:MAG: nucleotidyltransferase domain-containing protein [Candidatus Bathyarchaeia archaeon]